VLNRDRAIGRVHLDESKAWKIHDNRRMAVPLTG
jgi:hypothetical protein